LTKEILLKCEDFDQIDKIEELLEDDNFIIKNYKHVKKGYECLTPMSILAEVVSEARIRIDAENKNLLGGFVRIGQQKTTS
jgi:hypothetical protein